MIGIDIRVVDGIAYIHRWEDTNELKYLETLSLEQLHELFEDLEEAVWEVRDAIRELEKGQ